MKESENLLPIWILTGRTSAIQEMASHEMEAMVQREKNQATEMKAGS